ncbi:MAG: SMI1/KNR4 family protein [Actinomycetota bacterium]
MELKWFLPDETRFPAPFQEIFCGECYWDLHQLVALEESRRSWISSVFPDPENEYDRVWHQKLAFMEVGNGDLLALDLGQEGAPVVYLSHDGGESHGYLLGRDFADFIDRWSLLGCPGAEDWQMAPFLSGPTSYLEVQGERAAQWRSVFGMPRLEG